MSRAQERLGEGRVIVADGGTGALVTAAVPRLRCPEEANLKAPEAVVGVHLGFIRAGAELIEANTLVPRMRIAAVEREAPARWLARARRLGSRQSSRRENGSFPSSSTRPRGRTRRLSWTPPSA